MQNNNPYELLRNSSENDSKSESWQVNVNKRQHKQNKPPFRQHINNYQNKRKTILCRSTLNETSCKWGVNCSYAHTLEEQDKYPTRKIAYDLLSDNSDLSHIDLNNNIELFKTLNILTSVCDLCETHQCQGGYNCLKGAITKKYQVCRDDLLYGVCENIQCNKNHLTRRGIKIIKNSQHSNKYTKNKNIFDNFGKKKVECILLTDEYFEKNRKNKVETNNTTDIFKDINEQNCDTECTYDSFGDLNDTDIGKSIFEINFNDLDKINL